MDLETRRQLIHMSGIAVPFYILWAHSNWGFNAPFLTLLLAISLLYSISLGYRRNIRIPIVARIIDISEREEVIKVSPGKGALMFLIGSAFTLVIFSFNIYIAAAAIAILALGDSFSTLVGRRIGSHKLAYNRMKSIEGSIAGVITALLGASIIVPLPMALFGALIGMLVESLPLKIDDNLTIPVFAGLAMVAYQFIF